MKINAFNLGMPYLWPQPKLLLIMKMTAFILIIALAQVSAKGFGQKISLNTNNTSLEKVLNTIEAQTGYVFLYEGRTLKEVKISVNLKDANIDAALKACFKDLPYTYNIEDKNILIRQKESTFLNKIMDVLAYVDIHGKVTGEDNQSLAGANVRVKGTSMVVTTNAQGEFSLRNVKENDVLVITFIGYKTKEVSVNGSKSLSIQMEPSSADLAQVMVTGYQTISKERATGAFTTINNDVLSKRPVSNLSSALQGLVAGMQAKENEDGSVDFLIRGNTSLYADAKPLIVVDGFPISSSDFSDINPNDVESVTVLKDAAAASIWGARSANGVIVVTTKRLKGNSKLQVNVNAFTRISNRVNLDQVLTQANSADQVAYERKAFENNWAPFPYTGSFDDITNSLTLAQELLYANLYGQIDAATMNAGLDRLSKINNRPQIQDLLMQKAILNQYNLNLQAGTDRVKTYASVMYENSKGSFKKNGYDRLNLNFNNDFKLTNFLSLNFGANLQYRKQETSGATTNEIQDLSPYEVLLNPDGSYGANLNTYNRAQLALIPSAQFPYSDWSYNLLQEVNGRSLTSEDLSARIQAGLNLKIMKGLTFDSKIQYERNKTDNSNYYDESTFYVRSLVNSMTVYDNNTKTVGLSYIPKGGILDAGNTDLTSYLIRNQLNFDKNIGDKHSISVIAGMEMSQYTTTGQSNPYAYGYFPDKNQSTVPPYGYGSSVDQFTDFQGYSTTIPGGNRTFSWSRDKYVSFYGNASYTYNNKYTVTGSVRSDASNFITDDPKLRWSPLWSVGGKWNVKNENFMSNVDPVDRLELRLTYGKNGNVEKSTSTEALLSVGTSLNPTTGTITGTVSSNGNPSLRWERTTTTNLGIDFALLKNKLFGSIDLYNKIGTGIIGNIALPAFTGTTTQKFNNAGITNRGIEITLGANFNIPNTPVRYSTSLNYAYNYNKINDLYNPALYVYDVIGGEFIQGRPVNSIYSYTYKGMVDGVPQVAGLNGTLNPFDDATLDIQSLAVAGSYLNYEGTSTPPHTLGWLNNFQVGSFGLTVIFDGKLGGVYRNPTFNYSDSYIGFGKTVVNKWVSNVLAGDPNIPGFPKPNDTDVFLWDIYTPYLNTLVESSSYIECKEVTLEYNLSKKLAKAIQVNNIKVFATARDLGLIWEANKNGYNPDWLPGTNRPLQTYTFGVNLQF